MWQIATWAFGTFKFDSVATQTTFFNWVRESRTANDEPTSTAEVASLAQWVDTSSNFALIALEKFTHHTFVHSHDRTKKTT